MDRYGLELKHFEQNKKQRPTPRAPHLCERVLWVRDDTDYMYAHLTLASEVWQEELAQHNVDTRLSLSIIAAFYHMLWAELVATGMDKVRAQDIDQARGERALRDFMFQRAYGGRHG